MKARSSLSLPVGSTTIERSVPLLDIPGL
jgi:hypothetical protein